MALIGFCPLFCKVPWPEVWRCFVCYPSLSVNHLLSLWLTCLTFLLTAYLLLTQFFYFCLNENVPMSPSDFRLIPQHNKFFDTFDTHFTYHIYLTLCWQGFSRLFWILFSGNLLHHWLPKCNMIGCSCFCLSAFAFVLIYSLWPYCIYSLVYGTNLGKNTW